MTDEAPNQLVIAVVGNLGDPAKGDPQISLHTSVDRDAPASLWDTTLDKIAASFERQAAKAEITRIQAHIRVCEKTIADTYAGDKEREDDYTARRAELNEQIKATLDQIPAITAGDQAKWDQSDRAGKYQPSREATSRIGGLKKEASGLHAELLKLDLEKSQGLKAIERVVANQRAQIEHATAEMERLRAIVSGDSPVKLAAE